MYEPFARVGSATEFYHRDALGTTLLLTDETGTVKTTYTYTPFGETTVTGSASTNPFQYAGRENDGNSLYYYRARYYSPQFERFISEDPIGFAGGDTNLYRYVDNNPLNFVDPSGLTLQTNWNFFWDWALGRGPRNRSYGPNDIETQEMKNSIGADLLRAKFFQNNCQNATDIAYKTGRAYWDTLGNPFTADPSSTSAQVGGFAGASAINNGNGAVTYSIRNIAGTKSFFYHALPNKSGPTGPMSNIVQTFQWTEPIGGRKDGCQ